MSSNEIRISRTHAACMLFGNPHTRENEERYLLKLDDIGHGLTLCHRGDPEQPVLMTNAYLNKHPSHYTEYLNENNLEVSKDDSISDSSLEYGKLCKFYLILVYLLYVMQR